MRRVFVTFVACLVLACAGRPDEPADAGTGPATTDGGSTAGDGGSVSDGGETALSPGCGDVGEPATGTCQSGAATTTPIRGIVCTNFEVKIGGVPVALNFDRKHVGKTVYSRDGSSGVVSQTAPTLDGCGGTGYAALNFRDSAGTQRLELVFGNYDFSNPSSKDASTHADRTGCLISAEVWDANGVHLGRFQSPPVDPIRSGEATQALALQSGTFDCSSGLARPLEMTFNAVKLVNLRGGNVGDHTLELSGKLSVEK